jgi:hypothetical protein
MIKKFLDIFKPSSSKGNSLGVADRLTNKKLLAELSDHFKEVLEEESVGNRMLYPMAFNILMEENDYAARKQSLPFILPEVVSTFYSIIKEKSSEHPDYTPPARYWYFQFSPCRLGSIQMDDTNALVVRKGHLTTFATLLAQDISEESNIIIDSNARVSVRLDDSNVMNTVNLNKEAVKHLDMVSAGVFKYKFDPNLNGDKKEITAQSNIGEVSGYAELSYSKGGRNIRFSMKDELIHLSGNNEKRKGRAFFILDSSSIKDSHVQIRRIEEGNKFQIAVFGPVRVNQRSLEVSSVGKILWYDLANNSSIFVNEELSVKFEIK